MYNDRLQILRLMNEYCYCIDTGDLAGFANLFRHGTWRVQGDPNGGDTGSEAVLETLQNVILYDGRPLTKHVMSNVQINIDQGGETANAQSYISLFQGVANDFPLQVIFIGHYYDTFKKNNGEWQFLLRDIRPDLIGDFSYHRSDMA